jgi:hypothetical protein
MNFLRNFKHNIINKVFYSSRKIGRAVCDFIEKDVNDINLYLNSVNCNQFKIKPLRCKELIIKFISSIEFFFLFEIPFIYFGTKNIIVLLEFLSFFY